MAIFTFKPKINKHVKRRQLRKLLAHVHVYGLTLDERRYSRHSPKRLRWAVSLREARRLRNRAQRLKDLGR